MANVVSNSVEVCIFRFRQHAPEYLIIRRAAEEHVYPGMWQFVTGMVEGSERALTCALREVTEETGLHPVHFWIVPHANSFYSAHSDAVHLVPFFAAQTDAGAEPKLSREHSEYVWLRQDEARQRLVWPGQRLGLDIVHQYIVRGEEAGSLLKVPLPQR
jgi:8-oxo-dGTP pyrophosphatase MutT (NUDIX family)